MWNMVASSAADSSVGLAKKLREKTSKARCRAASGKLMLFRNVSASMWSRRSKMSGSDTAASGAAARASILTRSVSRKVGLRNANTSAFHGGVRGRPRKVSWRPAPSMSG